LHKKSVPRDSKTYLLKHVFSFLKIFLKLKFFAQKISKQDLSLAPKLYENYFIII